MKLDNIAKAKRGGFTLIEITLVISLILGLIAVLVIGAQAYHKGTQKARCAMNVNTAQKAVRSYANLNEINPGEPYGTGLIAEDVLVGPGKVLEEKPMCDATAPYSGWDGTHVPIIGVVAIYCNTYLIEHLPKDTSGW